MNAVVPPRIPTTPASPELLAVLHDLLGDKGLLTAPDDMRPFLTDWRGQLTGTAAAVARPASTEDVAGLVRLCAAAGVAIVPQGGNTGLMGGATPYAHHAGIVVSMGRMNRVIAVDPMGYTMTVESGCVLQTLQELASSHDRLLPLSLGAQGSCTIGGNLSTNAGGAQVLHYGNTRSFVLGVDQRVRHGSSHSRRGLPVSNAVTSRARSCLRSRRFKAWFSRRIVWSTRASSRSAISSARWRTNSSREGSGTNA